MKRGRVFVLEVAEREIFAFEAEDTSAAESVIRQPTFIAALDEFCVSRRVKRSTHAPRPREATAMEAAFFDRQLREFPEAAGDLLVARLPPES